MSPSLATQIRKSLDFKRNRGIFATYFTISDEAKCRRSEYVRNEKNFLVYWSYAVVAAVLLAAVIYLLVNGEDVYVPIHDNLDNIAILKVLRENGLFWSQKTTTPILGGISRNYFSSDLAPYTWLYMLLPMYTAYAAGLLLKVVIAVAGAAYLGQTILRERYAEHRNIIVLCGLLYGLAPNFPTAAFAFAALPFYMAVAISFYREPRWWYYLLFLISPAFLSFSAFGIFACGYLLLFFFIDWAATKKAKPRFLLATAAVALGCVIVEWRLFYLILFSGEETLRGGMAGDYLSLPQTLRQILVAFVHGHYHSTVVHMYFVLPVCFVYFVYLNIGIIKKDGWKRCWQEPYNWLMLWLLFNAIFDGLDEYGPFKELIHVLIPPLTGFGFARTLWFNGFIWCFAFAIILCRLKNQRLKYALCMIALLVVCLNHEGANIYNHISGNIAFQAEELSGERTTMSYQEFYSEALFDEIKREIDYDGEWSVAFGMHPAVIEYNGIATLDGYQSFYSQAYKDQFRRLIAPELAVNEEQRRGFDQWGGRAYVYSEECPYAPVMEMQNPEAELRIDPVVFREMGGKYVFSRVKLTNAEELALEPAGVFSRYDSPYVIYVYSAI